MGALPPVPQVLRLRLSWTIDGDTLGITNHYARYTGGPPSPSNCVGMGAAVVAAAASGFQAVCHPQVGATSCEVTDLTSSTSAQGTGGAPWNGTGSGAALAPGSCVLFNHSISRRYRGGKPRSYVPLGTASSLTSAGLWSSAAVTAFGAAWSTFQADVLAGGVGCTLTAMVNVSYYDGFMAVENPITHRWRNVPQLRTGGPVLDTINATLASARVGSQRRRNRDA